QYRQPGVAALPAASLRRLLRHQVVRKFKIIVIGPIRNRRHVQPFVLPRCAKPAFGRSGLKTHSLILDTLELVVARDYVSGSWHRETAWPAELAGCLTLSPGQGRRPRLTC